MLTSFEGFGNAAFAAPECGAGSLDGAEEASDVYDDFDVVGFDESAAKRQIIPAAAVPQPAPANKHRTKKVSRPE